MTLRYERIIRDHFKVTSLSGQEFLCYCSWHPDTSQGHLYVNGHSGLYLCMSCGAKGTLENLGLPRLVVGSDDVRERIRAIRNKGKDTTRYYPETWLKQFDVPHPYWAEEREIPEDVIEMFRLGYDPFSDRCTLPLRDLHGRVLGVTQRRLDGGKPKYQHPKGFPIGRHLYGAWLLTDQRQVALMEGQVDAIHGWAARVPSLALMGSRITADQIKVLQRLNIRRVVLMLDNDAAGTKGTVQVYESLRGSGIMVKAGWYRPYWNNVKDPDGLNFTRLRKMYHSSVSVHEWADRVAQ